MTEDSCKSWKKLNSGISRDISSIRMYNKDTGLIASRDSILSTIDGCKNWTKVFEDWFRGPDHIQFNEQGFTWCFGLSALYRINNYGLPCNFSVDLGNDTSIFIYDTIILNPGKGHREYLWNDQTFSSTKLVDAFAIGLGTHNIAVKVSTQGGCVATDTLKLTVQGCTKSMNIGNDTSINNYQSIGFSAGSGYSAFKWFDNSTSQTINLSGALLGTGTHQIFVRAIDSNGCMGGDTLNLTVSGCTFPYFGLGNDTFLFTSQKMTLFADSGYLEYTWNDNSKNQSIEVDGSKLNAGDYYYYVTLRDSMNCAGIDSIKITVKNCNIKVELGNDSSICADTNIILDAGKNFDRYIWNHGTDSTQTINVSKSGDYFVLLTSSQK